MKILLIADEESKILWDYFDPERLEGVELILSAGDLKSSYLEFLVTMLNIPLLYIHGNHDSHYERKPPNGCICIEDKIYNFNGLRILGLGGSVRYRKGPHMYTEMEMKVRCIRADFQATLRNGFDILLTHAPARGWGDLDDYPHRGFDCFNPLLEKWKPKYMVHGHVHQAYGHFQRERTHSCGTTIINACDYVILDVPTGAYPKPGKTGSPLYDLHIAMQRRKKHQ